MKSLGKVCRIRSRIHYAEDGGFFRQVVLITDEDYSLTFIQTFSSIEILSWMHGKELMIDRFEVAAHITCSGITIATVLERGLDLDVTFYLIAAAHARQKLESE